MDETPSSGAAPAPVRLTRVQLSEASVQAAVAVLRSGRLRQGEQVRSFEQEFAQLVGVREAVAVASGSTALLLAYLALFRPGDQVLVPAFTHISTVAMLRLAAAVPVLCDIDPRGWTIDPADAERRITARTRGLVGVHLYGGVCDVAALQRMAARWDLRLVWDACQAHLSRSGGRDVGLLGEACCYSFYPSKAMTTGEGGMVTTQDTQLAAHLRRLRDHGEREHYVHAEWGLNGRMTDIAAAIGRCELGELPARVAGRRRNARRLRAAVAGIPGLVPQGERRHTYHSYHQFALRVEESRLGRSRDEVACRLADRGIETAIHYPRPIHRQPLFVGADAWPLPHCEALARQVISLPVRHDLTAPELDRVIAGLREMAR